LQRSQNTNISFLRRRKLPRLCGGCLNDTSSNGFGGFLEHNLDPMGAVNTFNEMKAQYGDQYEKIFIVYNGFSFVVDFFVLFSHQK
jgi:hypothetical protein